MENLSKLTLLRVKNQEIDLPKKSIDLTSQSGQQLLVSKYIKFKKRMEAASCASSKS